jgi:hypothetical protein
MHTPARGLWFVSLWVRGCVPECVNVSVHGDGLCTVCLHHNGTVRAAAAVVTSRLTCAASCAPTPCYEPLLHHAQARPHREGVSAAVNVARQQRLLSTRHRSIAHQQHFRYNPISTPARQHGRAPATHTIQGRPQAASGCNGAHAEGSWSTHGSATTHAACPQPLAAAAHGQPRLCFRHQRCQGA